MSDSDSFWETLQIIPDRFLAIDLMSWFDGYEHSLKALDIPQRFLRTDSAVFPVQSAKSPNEEKEDDPRIPNRFKKQDGGQPAAEQPDRDRFRELVLEGRIPTRFVPEEMLKNNFPKFQQ